MITTPVCPVCGNTTFTNQTETRDFTVTNQKFTIKFCHSCGLGITDPRPADEEIPTYYESQNYISHSRNITTPIGYVYSIARRIALNRKWKLIKEFQTPTTALDFGCGTGSFLKFLKGKGVNVVGVEPSAVARTAAEETIAPSKVYPSLEDITSEFDVITLWHVLEHIPDLGTKLQHFKRVLKSHGTIFIAVPNTNSWESRHYGSNWAAWDTPRHLWHFGQTSMSQLLVRNGFKLLRTEPMLFDSYYISLLSEKYRNQNRHNISGIINAIINGRKSNKLADQTSEYSSLIYIATHE